MKELTAQETLEHIDMFREHLEQCLDEGKGEVSIPARIFFHAMKELCDKMNLPCLPLSDYVLVSQAKEPETGN